LRKRWINCFRPLCILVRLILSFTVCFPRGAWGTRCGDTSAARPCSPTERLVICARRHWIRITVRFLGPWAPNTRIRSMSPVLLGPVMNVIKLG